MSKESYMMQPEPIEVYHLGGKTDIILRTDILEETTEDGTIWTCVERQFRVNGTVETAEIEANFDKWWAGTPPTTPELTPTTEERLAALEGAMLVLLGGEEDV